MAFYIASGELDPLLEYIGKSAARLREMNYPVTMTQIAKKGREPFDAAQRRDVAAWIGCGWISSKASGSPIISVNVVASSAFFRSRRTRHLTNRAFFEKW